MPWGWERSKCFTWLDNFIRRYPSYNPWGPIGTAGKITLCDGRIVLEPLKIPIKGRDEGKRIYTRRNVWRGGKKSSYIDHGVMKVTIGKCTVYFDIGSQSDQGDFGGDDHWFFEDNSDFNNLLDLPKAEPRLPDWMNKEGD